MRKAFSLIELMISVLVLMVALPSLLLSFFNLFAMNALTEEFTVATSDARRVIEQMRSLSATSLALVTGQNWTTWAASNGCTSLPSEQVSVTYTDRDLSGDALDDNPLEPTVSVNWQARGRVYSFDFSTLITER